MPLLKPPSRVEPLPFPTFGISWFADPSSGLSILAYCGGGGSARTGVGNQICIFCNSEPKRSISTGAVLGLDVHIYRNPTDTTSSSHVWLAVALDQNQVRRYRMNINAENENEKKDEENEYSVIHVGEPCSKLAVNSMADRLAVGCDSGHVFVYAISDDRFDDACLLFNFATHNKGIGQLAFSLRGARLMSASKDGTACIYHENNVLTAFKCSVEDKNAPPPKIKPTVMVRGCAFLDLEGRVAVTVASAKRGRAFIAQWEQDETSGAFACTARTPCSECPISSMNLSQDGATLALGAVDGSIILWSTEQWKSIGMFKEVHDFPVTCIATRPYPVPVLEGEEDGVRIDARSASGDGKLGCLTLQRRVPKRAGSTGRPVNYVVMVMEAVNGIVLFLLFLWILSPVWREAQDKCGSGDGARTRNTLLNDDRSLWRCIRDDVILAPSDRPGILVPPY